MDFKQLEYFVRVAELGSFTRAAQALNVAQPALSRQVRQLELELRQHLLLRNGRGVTLTEAGQLLLKHGRGILHQVAHAQEELGRVRGALNGRVAVGLPPSLARALAVPLTRAFKQRLPQASLSISEGLSTAMQERLQQGALDIALLYNAQPVAGLDIQPLHEEALFLVAKRAPGLAQEPPPGAISLTEVASLPLVIPSRPNAIRMHIEAHMSRINTQPRVALEIDGVPAILDLVADGAGYAILPRNAVLRSTSPGAFVMRAINPPELRIALFTAVSALRPVTLTQATTRGLIADILADQAVQNI